MKLDEDKIDDVVLALLQLTAFGDGGVTRSWKSQSWEVMDRLHQKGWISDPKSKSKSLVFTEEGLMRSEFMFREIFMDDSKPEKKAKNKSKPTGALRLRVSLRDTEPEIWREFCVPDDITLGDLHTVIQVVMEWDNSHLHQFIHKKRYIGVPMVDDWRVVIDEENVCVSEIFVRKGSRIEYQYDFGDDWLHDVVSLGKADPGEPLFQVRAGAMASPPEDCGGTWGYYQLLEALGDFQHPQHEHWSSWYEGELDPTAFDMKKINAKLRDYFAHRMLT